MANQQLSWINFYSKSSHTDHTRGAIWNDRYDICDEAVNEVASQEAELLNFFLANQSYDFAVAPSWEKGNVQCMHNCFVSEDESNGVQRLIGVKGIYFSSPWKMLPCKSLISHLKIPQQTRSKPSTYPNLEDFLQCTTSEEFADLSGSQESRPIDGLLKLPNIHFMHPALFVSCITHQNMPAEDLAISIIKEAASGCVIVAFAGARN